MTMASRGQLRESEGDNVHFLHGPATRAPAANLKFLKFKVENLAQIRMAYGDVAADAAMEHLAALLVDCLRTGQVKCEVLAGGDGVCLVLPDECDLTGSNLPENWIDSFCDLVALIPFAVEGDTIHLFVSGNWNVSQGEASTGPTLARFLGQPVGLGDLWAARYRADMAVVASVIAALDCRVDYAPKIEAPFQLLMGWQVVRRVTSKAGAGGDVFYCQTRPTLMGQDGQWCDFADVRRVLERLGFAALVDGWLVDRVLLELEVNPGIILGIGISAHSLRDAGWWRDVATRLQHEPSIACRLVVEITETAAIPDISAAANLLRRIQRLGCRFAIDNFGLGFASIRELIVLMPDIVRLDPMFLSAPFVQSLPHLAGLAQSFAPTVIATGINDREQSELASGAGVIWQQGAHFGAPTIARPWRLGDRAFVEALWPPLSLVPEDRG